MSNNHEGKKVGIGFVGILERIALVIAFGFAVYLIGTHSDWIQEKALLVQLYWNADASDQGYEVVPAEIEDTVISVLIADTPEKWELGLSGREVLSSKKGMLFVFDSPQRHGIWMKDMLFPIDIIWLDENMRVIQTMTDIEPDTYPQVFEPETQDLYVLEMRAGFVDRANIKIGSELVIYR